LDQRFPELRLDPGDIDETCANKIVTVSCSTQLFTFNMERTSYILLEENIDVRFVLHQQIPISKFLTGPDRESNPQSIALKASYANQTVIVTNSTNINKTNNHLSSQTIEQNKTSFVSF